MINDTDCPIRRTDSAVRKLLSYLDELDESLRGDYEAAEARKARKEEARGPLIHRNIEVFAQAARQGNFHIDI